MIAKLLLVLVAGPVSAQGGETDPAVSANAWERVGETRLMRLAVPSGWLVRAGEGLDGESMLFIPDREYAWRRAPNPALETLVIEGGDLERIQVPNGWVVRMKDGATAAQLVFVPDRRLVWQPKR